MGGFPRTRPFVFAPHLNQKQALKEPPKGGEPNNWPFLPSSD
jgi:hypothetical protein